MAWWQSRVILRSSSLLLSRTNLQAKYIQAITFTCAGIARRGDWEMYLAISYSRVTYMFNSQRWGNTDTKPI